MADLLTLHLQLENNYLADGEYDLDLITNGHCAFCSADKDRYTFSLTLASNNSDRYVISASPINSQKSDKCKILTINGRAKTTAEDINCW